ncbi:MAG: hypothetical protein KJ718_02320 [Nanoarchaeota archaeon]|nr:hypothetical protein [Nanoarchaeota archaeon]MBU1051366.1 hypothetical protein [Nanoarchaeota archaeon]MBU1988381.1 hypothetical protein [Nanoarchaeota archaeon]
MKTRLSKTEAREKIEEFFKREDFTSEEIKKMKRMAMKFNIRLDGKRKLFCKKCLSRLRGKTRVSKTHKTVECGICGERNKFKIK